MELCVSTFICYKESLTELLPVFAKSGVKNLELWGAFSFGSELHFPYWKPGFIETFQKVLVQNGLQANTLHAPFSEILDLSTRNERHRIAAVEEVKRAANIFRKLPEAKTVIVHPGGFITNPDREKERLNQSRKSITELASFLSGLKLNLAVENMLPELIAWTYSDLEFLTEGLPNTGICLDTGHAFISGNLKELIREFGENIITYHISDTFDSQDRHLLPYEGSVDWDYFKKTALDNKEPALLTFETRTRGELKKALKEVTSSFRRLNGDNLN
ncbi:MAG: sugar phosphate isomerase/epimerase family protein [Candidatus Omnitrophota bacterium]